jgi:Flp pilus assembly pilin Flp
MFIYLNKKAQSTAEYVLILGFVVAAVIAMQTYVKRGLQGRIRDVVDYTGQETKSGGADVVKFSAAQYEPYYLESSFDNTHRTTNENEKVLTGGAIDRTLENEHTTRKGKQTYHLGEADNE